MFVYFIPLLFLFLMSASNEKFSNSKIIIIISTLVLICALREPGVDKDSLNYYYGWFLQKKDYIFENDILSNSVFYISRYFSKDNITYSFFIFALLSITPKIYIYSKFSRNSFIALLFYYTYFFFVFDMTQIRAAVAISFALIAIVLWSREKHKYALLFILIGSMFHLSILIFLWFFIFRIDKINILIYIGIGLLVFILGVFNISLIGFISSILPGFLRSRVSSYLISGQQANILNPITMFYFIFVTTVLFKIFHKKYLFTNLEVLASKIAYLAFIALFLFKDNIDLAFRLYDLFLITIPIVIASLSPQIKQKTLYIIFSILIASISLYNQLFYLKAITVYKINF